MHSHEAIQKAISGKTIEHAKALHLSSSLVHKWQEPHTDFTDSGTLNPLDRLETLIQTALNLGTPSANAMAPVQFLSERFNQALIPYPISFRSTDSITKDLLETIEMFGSLSALSAKSLKDGHITKREALAIREMGNDLIRHVLAFMETTGKAAR